MCIYIYIYIERERDIIVIITKLVTVLSTHLDYTLRHGAREKSSKT